MVQEPRESRKKPPSNFEQWGKYSCCNYVKFLVHLSNFNLLQLNWVTNECELNVTNVKYPIYSTLLQIKFSRAPILYISSSIYLSS